MTNSENIVLIARLKVKSESVEEAKRAALAIIEDSRAETGCLNYDFHQAIDDESVFVRHETWANRAVIEEHGQSAHFKKFSKAIENIIEEPLHLTFAKMVSERA